MRECVHVCICLKTESEERAIHYCHRASSANTWRIEPSEQKAVTISGSFPLRTDPCYGTNEEDKGDDRLTSGPSAPVYDINERKAERLDKVRLCEVCIHWKKESR